MKKLFSILLSLSILMSLAVTASAAEDSDQNAFQDDTYYSLMEEKAKESSVELSGQYVVFKIPGGRSVELKLSSTESELSAFWCSVVKNPMEDLIPILGEYIVDFVLDESNQKVPTIEITSDGYSVTTTNFAASSEVYLCLGLLEEVSQDTTVTLNVASSSTTGAGFDPETKEITYAFQAPAEPEEPDDAGITMNISTDKDVSSREGIQVYLNDTIEVGFTPADGFNGSDITLSYNETVFEPTELPTGWTQDEDANEATLSYSGSNAEGESMPAVSFKAKGQKNDNVDAEFELKYTVSGDEKTVEDTAQVLLKPIEYEIVGLNMAPTIPTLAFTYDGKEHSVQVNVTDPVDTKVEYATNSIPGSALTWTEETPSYKDVIEDYISIKITSNEDGYKTAEERVSFRINRADVTITPKDETIYVGDSVPTTFKYEMEGLFEGDSLQIEPSFTVEGQVDTSTTGDYTIKANRDADAGDNYRITYGTGTLHVIARPSGGGGGGSGSSNTTTETTKNPDGSTTTTVTNKVTGTVTETTKSPDGSTTTVETKKDGSTTETVKTADGVTGTVATDKNGDITEVSASVSSAAAKDAAETGAAVTLPVEVPSARTISDAPAVEVSLPRSARTVKVEIPVEDVTPSTVAYILYADGTEELVKTSLPTEDGVALTLDGSATVKIVDNSKAFSDTDGHWAEDSIAFTTARELFAGTSDTTFTPEGPMTRAMLMTVLARFDGQDTTGGAVWYEKGMAWAVENGISDGSNPDGNITREQFATMLWRYAGSPAVSGMTLNEFSDSVSISSYAVDAMRWAVSTGIIGGTDTGLLMPQGNATRAQVATMLMRFVENLSK